VKVLVLVKQVPDTEATIRISADRKKIDETSVKFIVNPYDEFAIEEALKLKESGAAASITAVSLGPDRVKEALRTAVAMGVDDVLHLKTESLSMDGLASAKLLSESIKEIGFDLLLMGKEAIDDGNMQVGSTLAELLDVPCLSVVTALQVNGASVVAEREGDGCTEVLEAQLPCIVTCQKGLNEPRYPSIRGVMLAKKKEIAEKVVQSGGQSVSVESLSYPQARQGGMIIGEGVAAVPELVKRLREEAKVI
jgi:electron transfer flavoprotein beta subunit